MSIFGGGIRRTITGARSQITQPRGSVGPGYNALVLGSGGREYALAWRLARDNSVSSIDVTPGNAAEALFARILAFPPTDIARLQQHIAASQIDLAIVGPDDLIARGLGDDLRRTGIAVLAASKDASKLEWSKSYAKEVMDEAKVPTAPWRSFLNVAAARAYLEQHDGAVVVKADGLAGGKGVVVARDRAEALFALDVSYMKDGIVVLEDMLEGPECSLQAFVDGETVVALPPARDHKRVGDGDTGPNTGGMGAVSPTRVLPDDEAHDAAQALIAPVARVMAKRGTPYRGVIYAGLMRTAQGLKVIEYNARFGDPEAQVTLPRLAGDFGRIVAATGEGRLAGYVAKNPLRFEPRAYVSVAVCAKNYPGAPKLGDAISGLDELPEGVYAFHAGTAPSPKGGYVTAGGRVVHIVGSGETVAEARAKAYEGATHVRFDGAFYRGDIAQSEVGN